MVKVGETLDLGFEVRAVLNGERWSGRFAKLVRRPTVVSVYMKNNTGSCDAQTQQLEEIAEALSERGCDVLAVSKDSVGSHLRASERRGLGFVLVSDPEHAFAKATDSLVEKRMYGKTFFGPTRSAYLLDPSGKLLGLVEKVDAKRHGEQLLELIHDAFSGNE